MRFPFRKAKSVEVPQHPMQAKAASFMLSMGPGRYLATAAKYNDLATEGYTLNSVANACINRIATSAASVDLQLYQRKGGKLNRIESHPLLDLIENPNPAQSGREFMEWLVSYFYVSGNAYVFGNRGATGTLKVPTELQLLNPGTVRVEPGKGLFPAYYEHRLGSADSRRYDVDQASGRSAILHLKTFNPLDPWVGISPIIAAAFGIDIFNSGNKWNKRLLDNNARPSGALVVQKADGSPATLTDEQYLRLKEMIDEQFTGSNNAGKPLLLEGGLDWKEMSVNPKDLDFLNGKNSAATDIGLVFGVPSQLLGIPGSQTFANYEQAVLAFWTDAVLPRLSFILDGFNRWLTPLYGKDLYLWYDEEMIPALEPRRRQKADRINAAEYMTINEKRRAMGLDDYAPSDKPGDTLLVASSDIPLDLAGDQGLAEPGSVADKPQHDNGNIAD